VRYSRLLGAAFIGLHLARRYGLTRKHKVCALLSMAEIFLLFALIFYYAIMFAHALRTGYDIPNDVLAFMIMAHLISAVGIATLPAIVVESEQRRCDANFSLQRAMIFPRTKVCAT